jgi:hypothetical protein
VTAFVFVLRKLVVVALRGCRGQKGDKPWTSARWNI